MKKEIIVDLTLIVLMLIGGCSKSPEAIDYGNIDCAYCQMTVSDPKFGAELITESGKKYYFDSSECLAAYIISNDGKYHSAWVTNYKKPGNLIEVSQALFVISDGIKSPMGLGIAAFESDSVKNTGIEYGAEEIVNWERIKKYVKDEWF
ncbi:nitrous oxide reductase accessory protein NosL [Melioribacter sp. OK-6-Me]|uniref:nitrous oxide reductase accessory protein NosL n=1 Tax=unclassified Melioribacter TaxID=2627329 RepID=UPI003ED97F93